MTATVRIPTILRTFTQGASEVSAKGATVGGIIDDLDFRYSGIAARVLDENGQLRRFVNVYVDDDDVRYLEGIATPVRDGAQISIIPAVAGGSL